MKVSTSWLQNYFAEPLPSTEELVEALTFHSCEVEGVIGEGEKTVLDVKVLPDRAPYALSHRGIAYELGAALNRPLIHDPLHTPVEAFANAGSDTIDKQISVSLENPETCPRYMAALITGVKVGPSPAWLKEALETLGQRSINNVVDATNYVMLNIGQPLHAFDAGKLLSNEQGAKNILVRGAKEGEKITSLTGEEYSLPVDTLLITDGNSGAPLGVAGVKGGKAAELTNETTDILIESANFEGTGVRKTSQALKLWTDASLRYQNKISPELTAYGMRDVLALILECAGGVLVGVSDTYPSPATPSTPVEFTVQMINGLLGTTYTPDDCTEALSRLGLSFEVSTKSTGEFSITVTPPFERRDLVIWQDMAEEIGRVLGYDRVLSAPLPPLETPPNQKRFAGIEAIKDVLVEHGFIEISTQSFAASGEVQLENPLQQDKPWLRASLSVNMEEALARAVQIAPRTLGPVHAVKLFELGTVFAKEMEYPSLVLGYRQLTGKQNASVLSDSLDALVTAFPGSGISREAHTDGPTLEISLNNVDFESIGQKYTPEKIILGPYHPFSNYPSALRDIAVWTPEGTEESEVASLIEGHAGELLARIDLFDRFEKKNDAVSLVSYAFRLVFQANDRTLSDADIDPGMEAIAAAIQKKEGWEVR